MRNFSVIGPGRAGHSFARALRARGWTLTKMCSRNDDWAGVADAADVVLITVPDDAISAVAARLTPGRAAVLHVSGAKGVDVLAPHQRRGSVHPLMSLPDADVGADRLIEGAVFAVAGDPMANEVVEALGGRAIAVEDELRPLYHASAAVAANHLVALCAQVERLAATVGVPIDAYWDLMETTLANVRRAGAVSSLTGPAARGDSSTLALHVASLPDDEHELYISLASATVRLAGRDPSVVLPQPRRLEPAEEGDG